MTCTEIGFPTSRLNILPTRQEAREGVHHSFQSLFNWFNFRQRISANFLIANKF